MTWQGSIPSMVAACALALAIGCGKDAVRLRCAPLGTDGGAGGHARRPPCPVADPKRHGERWWVMLSDHEDLASSSQSKHSKKAIALPSVPKEGTTQLIWKNLRIVSPDGRRILALSGNGSLRKLGLSEFFFESDEPALEDLPLKDFLAMFPEGEYKFFGTTPDGEKLLSTARFSHEIPDGPVIVSPALQDRDNAVIRWNLVTSPPGIAIASYEVVIEQEDRTFDVKLPGTATSVTIPSEFLAPGTEYLFEVLAKAENGNQTITESSFSTN
jgi:hypothetical protein